MSDNGFLTELKDQFNRNIELKERLDTKANNMIGMSGTIATLFMGFGVFLISDIVFTKNVILPIFASVILIAEVLLTVCTIKHALDSYKLREYVHPIIFEPFYNGNEIRDDVLNQFQSATDSQIKEHFAKEYLKGIKSYQEQNEQQTHGINISQKMFVLAVVMIPIFSIIIILAKFFSA